MSKSLKFMLLGIAILLFTTAGARLLDLVYIPMLYAFHPSQTALILLYSVLPVAGLVLVLVGFFMRD